MTIQGQRRVALKLGAKPDSQVPWPAILSVAVIGLLVFSYYIGQRSSSPVTQTSMPAAESTNTELPTGKDDKSRCERCNGSGRRQAFDRPKCGGCNGTGQKKLFKKKFLDPESETCRRCDGSGEEQLNIRGDWSCPDCGGKGYSSLTEALDESPYFKACPTCQGGKATPERYVRTTTGHTACAGCRGSFMVKRDAEESK